MASSESNPAPEAGREADHYRRLEREWQDDVGYALLDRPYETPGSRAVFHHQFDKLIALVDPERARRVIEIGCGKGHFLARLRDALGPGDRRFVGLDISRAVRSLAERRLLGVQAQGEFLPFRDASADYVIYDGSLHHCIDYLGALRESIRILAPGGSIIVFEPHTSRFNQWMHRLLDPIIFRASLQYESPIDIHYKSSFSLERIRDELRAHGFEVSEKKSDFLAYPFTGCYARSPFEKSERLLSGLISIEEHLARVPWLRGFLAAFAWRFTLFATKPAG